LRSKGRRRYWNQIAWTVLWSLLWVVIAVPTVGTSFMPGFAGRLNGMVGALRRNRLLRMQAR